MDRTERKDRILQLLLRERGRPVPGSELSASLGVSRQSIVQDVALLKAAGYEILSTARGYCLSAVPYRQRVVKLRHTDAQIEEELNTVVDLGGRVADVFVKHKAYGELHAKLAISSRRDIRNYLEAIRTGKSVPLKNLTSDYHYHTIEAPDETVLDLIVRALQEKGMLADLLDYEYEGEHDRHVNGISQKTAQP